MAGGDLPGVGHRRERGILRAAALVDSEPCRLARRVERAAGMEPAPGRDARRVGRFAGEDLLLETTLTRRRGPLGQGTGTASVDGVTTCTAELTFALVDPAEAGP